MRKAFGDFGLAVPFVLTRERPNGVCGFLRAAVFFDQAGGRSVAHVVIDRSGVLAAKAESFEEPLTHRGDVDVEFAHTVIDDRRTDGWMFRCFVLNDLQRPNAGALLASRAEKRRPSRVGPSRVALAADK